MAYEERERVFRDKIKCFSDYQYFKVGVQFTIVTDICLSKEQSCYRLSPLTNSFIIRGDLLKRILMIDIINVTNSITEDGFTALKQGVPLIYMYIKNKYYRNAGIITSIEKASDNDIEKYAKIMNYKPYTLYDRRYEANIPINLYTGEIQDNMQLIENYKN